MIVRWTPDAEDDLERAYHFLLARSPRSAADLEDALLAAAGGLGSFSMRGRVGRVEGTRELVVSATAYLIVYRVVDDGVQILRILHGQQLWPPADQ